ncbi:MAG: N-acetyl-gamma-glutamyl-phosphate reductase [Clostridia bacterium]|nr:N-acetyl-gamma-glutamyl-phosphate reductase [Clostridia bacterium]
MTKVFIDGNSGTTGLRIYERLSERRDVELLVLPDEVRKEAARRAEMYSRADVVFLCLPDEAAKEAVALAEETGAKAVIIDSSTAHRTAPGWTYGFPELYGQREKIANSKRIANPGCHASGFIALVRPLVEKGLIRPDARLSCTSLTGYSGGGKKMIAEYEDASRSPLLDAPRLYGLTQTHKHLPEMKEYCRLDFPPVFCPVVAPYKCGMEVIVPLTRDDFRGTVSEITSAYEGYYRSGLIRVNTGSSESGFLSSGAFSGRDDMELSVFGGENGLTLVSRFDNLGKGASGSAIQNFNIITGTDETEGLVV